MSDASRNEEPHGCVPAEIDTSEASPVRVTNYLAGGWANFTVDRELADRFSEVLGGFEAARGAVWMQRSLMAETVRRLASGGVGQFLELGCGVPPPEAELVHEIAQRELPTARVVYVVDEPVVLAHAHQFRRSGPWDASGVVPTSLDDPQAILTHAAETLDLTEPVAVLAVGVLHHHTNPYGTVARLVEAAAPGSYLVLTHLAADLRPEPVAALAGIASDTPDYRLVPRSHAEVSRFFDGLDMAEPGLVLLEDHLGVAAEEAGWAGLYYAGIGRIPGGQYP